MKFRIIAALAAPLALAACMEPGDDLEGDPIPELPDELIAMAGPNQDLNSVRLLEDGCYWYRHVGPVETTLLPLRHRDGRPLCTRLASS